MAHLNLVFSNVFQRLGLWDRGCCRHLYSVTASPASTVGTLPVVVSALRIALSTQPSPTHRWAAAPSSPYHPPVSGAAGPDAPLLCSLAQCGWGGSLCELLRATSPPPQPPPLAALPFPFMCCSVSSFLLSMFSAIVDNDVYPPFPSNVLADHCGFNSARWTYHKRATRSAPWQTALFRTTAMCLLPPPISFAPPSSAR
jgi:hypothetical protein